MVSEGVIEGVRTDRGVRIKRVSIKGGGGGGGGGGGSTLSTLANPDLQIRGRGPVIQTLR